MCSVNVSTHYLRERVVQVHVSLVETHLSLIVVVEGSKPPPGGALGGQLDHTRSKHEPEEQPAQEPQTNPIMRLGGRPGVK